MHRVGLPSLIDGNSVNSLRFSHALKTQSIIGGVVRALLIVFALAGIPHFLRVLSNPPSLNDMYPVWLGSRELLVHHRNPYSAQVTQEIQTAYSGVDLAHGAHQDQQCCFAYPVYASLLLAPTVKSDFLSLRLPALVVLTLLTGIGSACWHHVTRRAAHQLVFVIPLVLISPPVLQGLELRQAAMLVAALLSGAAILADRGRFTLAGIALALATIKPQMCILPIAWMLLWALHGWPTRKTLAIGFGATMLLLVGAGEILLPGWMSDFLTQLRLYRHYAGASMLELLYGRAIGITLTAVFILGLLVLLWTRRATLDFVPTLALVLAVEVVIMPGLKSLLNLVLFIPGIFILLSQYPVRAIVPAPHPSESK
jgi:glycosyl transferase family 87